MLYVHSLWAKFLNNFGWVAKKYAENRGSRNEDKSEVSVAKRVAAKHTPTRPIAAPKEQRHPGASGPLKGTRDPAFHDTPNDSIMKCRTPSPQSERPQE